MRERATIRAGTTNIAVVLKVSSHIQKKKKIINMISQHDRKCDLLFLHQGPEPSSSEEIILGFGGKM